MVIIFIFIIQGRGIAIFRADKIKPLKEIRKNKSLSIEDKTKVIK